MTNRFTQRKQAVLSKADKSSSGNWDEKIKSVCDKINKKENYYTTSSCSGRILVMIDQEKKGPGLFEFVSHDLIEFENFWKYLPNEKAKLNLKFKSEPPIIHVACKTLDDAENFLKIAQDSGWKRYGVISLGKNIVVELIGSEKLEFPLTKNGKLLVSDEFLKIVIERANENLKKGWKRIWELGKRL